MNRGAEGLYSGISKARERMRVLLAQAKRLCSVILVPSTEIRCMSDRISSLLMGGFMLQHSSTKNNEKNQTTGTGVSNYASVYTHPLRAASSSSRDCNRNHKNLNKRSKPTVV